MRYRECRCGRGRSLRKPRLATILLLTLLQAGCFNGLVLTPTNVGGPLSQTVIADSKSCICCWKVALIDVDGMIMNARGSALFGSSENPVSLFRERLDE